MDWREEYKRCNELAQQNSEAGLKQEYSYWTGRADGVRWLGEIVDFNGRMKEFANAIKAEEERK